VPSNKMRSRKHSKSRRNIGNTLLLVDGTTLKGQCVCENDISYLIKLFY